MSITSKAIYFASTVEAACY